MLSFNSKACDDHSRGDPFPPTYTHTHAHTKEASQLALQDRDKIEKRLRILRNQSIIVRSLARSTGQLPIRNGLQIVG